MFTVNRGVIESTVPLNIERLEQRMLLSVVPPTVTDVAISNSAWTQSFLDYLQVNGMGNNGYSIPVGSAVQSSTLPWSDLDRISITFSEDVQIQASDLSISGTVHASYTIEDFFYDPVELVATWTLSDALAANERAHLDLDADGVDPVKDLDGNILDGEWINEFSDYNSGNGTAGGDFEFDFNVLEADAYGDAVSAAVVDFFDYSFILGANGLSTADSNYDPMYDLDGSGLIDSSDWQEVLNHLWATLSTGTPVGATNDAPTTIGFDLVAITDRGADTLIALDAVFEDFEDDDSSLTYTISDQTNSQLFDSVEINPLTGQLVLNAAAVGSGRSEITITATDTAGLSVDTKLTVDVDRTNAAPVISNYVSIVLPGHVWEVSGTVTDADDEVEGLLVELSGLFPQRVAVAADGSFYFRIIWMPGDPGWEYAIVSDLHSELSNQPATYVGI